VVDAIERGHGGVEWVVVVDVHGRFHYDRWHYYILLLTTGYELDFGWGLLYDELVRRYQIYED